MGSGFSGYLEDFTYPDTRIYIEPYKDPRTDGGGAHDTLSWDGS
jgi:hypothetical protein